MASDSRNAEHDMGTRHMPTRTINSVRIYWDNQDRSNEGWAYRIKYRGGVEVSGPVDAITLAYAIDAVIYEHNMSVDATDFAIESDNGGAAFWDGVMVGDDLRDEIAEAVEAAGVCCPEQVADACLAVAANEGCWQAELAKAIANDASERKALQINE